MLNSKPAKLSQSCIVVMVFKAQLSLYLFLREPRSKSEFSARPGQSGHGAKARQGAGCAQGACWGHWEWPRALAVHKQLKLFKKKRSELEGGRALFKLFLHQVLPIPELSYVSQADFKTHLGAEPLWVSFQWEQHMAPLQCTFSPGSKQENPCIKISEMILPKARRSSMNPDFTNYCRMWDST